MQSEEMPRQLNIDRSSPHAISVVGDFTFESTDTEKTEASGNNAGEKSEPSDEPFTLQGVQMAVQKGKEALFGGYNILIWFRCLGLCCRPSGYWQVCPPVGSSGGDEADRRADHFLRRRVVWSATRISYS